LGGEILYDLNLDRNTVFGPESRGAIIKNEGVLEEASGSVQSHSLVPIKSEMESKPVDPPVVLVAANSISLESNNNIDSISTPGTLFIWSTLPI
jgi:hypothetical protein